jgi:LysM repeat protein
MKFEEREKNQRPEEGSKNLPMAVLFVLIGIICLLLFVGWKYFSDTPSTTEEMLPVKPDAVVTQMDDSTVANSDGMMTDETMPTTATSTAEEALPEITIPSAGGVKAEEKKTVATVEKTNVVTTANATPKPVAAETPKPASTSTQSAGSSYTHTVTTGETFFSIARRYNVSVDKLKEMNPSVNPETVKVGVTKIKAPIQAVHTVGPGDILRVVANKYGITVEQLMKANGKAKNNSQRGEKLVIPIK